VKLVVKEPTLRSPTETQISATERSVVRSSRRALEPTSKQVGVRRLAEGAAELAAEMSAREAGGVRHVLDAQQLEVAGVDEVPGAQQVANSGDGTHAPSISHRTHHRPVSATRRGRSNDAEGWSVYGAQQAQPVASTGKSRGRQIRGNMQNLLP
jgi:hypothetical protein